MVLLFGIEHAAILIGLLIMYFVSPVPHWVSVEMARQEYNKAEALRDKLEEDHAKLRESVHGAGGGDNSGRATRSAARR